MPSAARSVNRPRNTGKSWPSFRRSNRARYTACPCSTLFYGGVLVDAAAAFVLGVLLKVVIHQLEKLEASSFFVNIVGGAFTACGCYLAVKAGFALSQDKMIIGMLMNLVPGIALTNAMREFIAADLISGMIKFAEAVVTAIGIAIGVVVSLAIFTPFLEVLLV